MCKLLVRQLMRPLTSIGRTTPNLVTRHARPQAASSPPTGCGASLAPPTALAMHVSGYRLRTRVAPHDEFRHTTDQRTSGYVAPPPARPERRRGGRERASVITAEALDANGP